MAKSDACFNRGGPKGRREEGSRVFREALGHAPLIMLPHWKQTANDLDQKPLKLRERDGRGSQRLWCHPAIFAEREFRGA
jgi:hypothetical protein